MELPTFKITNVLNTPTFSVNCKSLKDLRKQAAQLFQKPNEAPVIHLKSDGTEIDDEEYFDLLEDNTELVAVFEGERWSDTNGQVTIICGDTTDAAAKSAYTKKLIESLRNKTSKIHAVVKDADLEALSSMDPNCHSDITGREFMDQLKDAGRPNYAQRTARDRIDLLRLLKANNVFCSERYTEETEAHDA